MDATSPHPMILTDECKGCGRCVAACPKKVLRSSGKVNRQSYVAVEYAGAGCSGCFICFYNCPEPFAIAVYRPDKEDGA